MMRTIFILTILMAGGIEGRDIRLYVRNNRIINGEDAKPGEFPSQVSLRLHNSHICGASVLNANWVLTAAHCLSGFNVSDISFLAGTIDIFQGGTVHQASDLVIHSGFNIQPTRNDIAVVKVENPFQIDNINVKPVLLPAEGQNPADGSVATVIGWGDTSEGGTFSEILQKVDIEIVNQKKCDDAYGGAILESQICADVPEGNKGACNGDSGGPLFVNGTIVGIVSWSYGCARQEYPTVYTRVSSYLDWIKQQTEV